MLTMNLIPTTTRDSHWLTGFDNLFDRGNGLDVLVMQSMAGVDHQAFLVAVARRFDDSLQLLLLLRALGVGIAPGVQFDDRCTGSDRGIELLEFGIDEQ